jgi:hypothetical protein
VSLYTTTSTRSSITFHHIEDVFGNEHEMHEILGSCGGGGGGVEYHIPLPLAIFLLGKGRPARKADNLTAIFEPIV